MLIPMAISALMSCEFHDRHGSGRSTSTGADYLTIEEMVAYYTAAYHRLFPSSK